MHKIIFSVLLVFISSISFSQEINVITEGVIEYEKKINKYALIERTLKDYSNSMKEDFNKYKSTQPQFLVLKSTLSFSKQKSLFIPLPDDNDRSQNYWNGAKITEQFNTVFSDFSLNKTITQKNIKGDYFLVEDSLKKIKWKITDETREIAGFQCRRANGLIMDSIYLVAFYTNQIPVSGGPESFSGLPGMILGIALPYENVSYFASKITKGSGIKEIIPPTKGKPMDYTNLKKVLEAIFKNDHLTLKEFLL